MSNYMEKSSREAKTHTSWTEKNTKYDEALQAFIGAAYADEEFLHDMEAFTAPLIWPGRVNALAQALLRMTAPGIPDQYQGSEIWDLSLVDPDNRRPVDYDVRRKLLCEMQKLSVAEVLSRADEGLPKLLVTHKTLTLRRDCPQAFGPKGVYAPLRARGSAEDHVLAFERGGEVAIVVPRLVLKLNGKWDDTEVELAKGSWRNVFTDEQVEGGAVRLERLFASFPVALLTRDK
ncbi:MAG: hypothetical protein JO022_00305 [Acidobacteriaceae bacterium]|nr:hypothetical protein [Acidobacteriaceae bacterium]